MDPKPEQIAPLPYGFIGRLVVETVPCGTLTRRAEEITARSYDIPYSTGRTVAIDTRLQDRTFQGVRRASSSIIPKTFYRL